MRKSRYGIFNKLSIKKPQQGYAQSLQFSSAIEHTENGTDKTTVNVFEREVDIIYEGFNHQYHLYRVQYLDAAFSLANKYKSDERLMKKISFVFDDLLLGVDQSGVVQQLLNMEAVHGRWVTVKAEVAGQHEGPAIENYLTGMDAFMVDERQVVEFLRLPGMYGNYFNGLWQAYQYGEARIHKVTYGSEAEGITVAENVNCRLVENGEENQIVELLIHTDEKEVDAYKGFYRYFNGLLHECERMIAINNTTITYTIKWKGLQPIVN